MEKGRPHYPLKIVKTLVQARMVKATGSALAGGAALGLSFEDMLDVILALTPYDFYKSMTSYADHCLWHDVYHCYTNFGTVYLKFTVMDDVLIVSFKER